MNLAAAWNPAGNSAETARCGANDELFFPPATLHTRAEFESANHD
jgi:hypothetical protein